jgi:hypothetical protein
MMSQVWLSPGSCFRLHEEISKPLKDLRTVLMDGADTAGIMAVLEWAVSCVWEEQNTDSWQLNDDLKQSNLRRRQELSGEWINSWNVLVYKR